ncbi:MAG: trehalase family glycosidase [Candidatus Margulisiibacteriota bacterium]
MTARVFRPTLFRMRKSKISDDLANKTEHVQRFFRQPNLPANWYVEAYHKAREMLFGSFTNSEKSLKDAKLAGKGHGVIYVPQTLLETEMPLHERLEALRTKIRILPLDYADRFSAMSTDAWLNQFQHGILHLPFDYISSSRLSGRRLGAADVRFNEQYYWDSYMFVLALLTMDHVQEAMGIVSNFFYEIEHFGMPLNANRTYCLGRSQPPLLSSMVMAIYRHLNETHRGDQALAFANRAIPFLVQEFKTWETHGFRTLQHQGRTVRLATYFDRFSLASPEACDEIRYKEELFGEPLSRLDLAHIGRERRKVAVKVRGVWYFDCKIQLKAIEALGNPVLTKLFKAKTKTRKTTPRHDTAQRASGLDSCHAAYEYRCADILDVSLNALLYKLADDIRTLADEIQHGAIKAHWSTQAEAIKCDMDLLWNNEHNCFQNRYVTADMQLGPFTQRTFINMVYPLMVGSATATQGQQVLQYVVDYFLNPNGIMNTEDPQVDQWEFMWPIMNYFANKAARMYRFDEDGNPLMITVGNETLSVDEFANQISLVYLNNLVRTYVKEGTFLEKQGAPDNYKNQPEFMWTAAIFLMLVHRNDHISGIVRHRHLIH